MCSNHLFLCSSHSFIKGEFDINDEHEGTDMLLLALKIISLPVPVIKDISIAFLAKIINVFFSSQLIVIVLRTEKVRRKLTFQWLTVKWGLGVVLCSRLENKE